MKTNNLIKMMMAALVVAALSSCASMKDSGPHYVPHPNGKGGIILAPQSR